MTRLRALGHLMGRNAKSAWCCQRVARHDFCPAYTLRSHQRHAVNAIHLYKLSVMSSGGETAAKNGKTNKITTSKLAILQQKV